MDLKLLERIIYGIVGQNNENVNHVSSRDELSYCFLLIVVNYIYCYKKEERKIYR